MNDTIKTIIDSLEKQTRGLAYVIGSRERRAYDAGVAVGEMGNAGLDTAVQDKAWATVVASEKLSGKDADTFWGGPSDPKSNLIYKAFQDGIADGNNNHQVTHRRLMSQPTPDQIYQSMRDGAPDDVTRSLIDAAWKAGQDPQWGGNIDRWQASAQYKGLPQTTDASMAFMTALRSAFEQGAFKAKIQAVNGSTETQALAPNSNARWIVAGVVVAGLSTAVWLWRRK